MLVTALDIVAWADLTQWLKDAQLPFDLQK